MRLKNHDIRLDNLHYWPANIKRTVLILINVLVILLGLLLESSVLSSITSSHQRNNELKKEL